MWELLLDLTSKEHMPCISFLFFSEKRLLKNDFNLNVKHPQLNICVCDREIRTCRICLKGKKRKRKGIY